MTGCISVALLTTCLYSLTTAQSYSNHSALYSAVLSGYNPNIVPVNDHSKPLTLAVKSFIYSLLDVDVVLGKVTLTLALTVEWVDSQIQWTPSDYGYQYSLMIPRKDVWSPIFILGTPVEFSTIGEPWMQVSYLYNGSARMDVVNVINSVCSFNVKYWPFDKHVCEVGLAVFGYMTFQVRLQSNSTNALYLLTENIEWDVVSANMFMRETFGVAEAIIRLEIERRSGIFVISVILPLYGIACLSPFAFLLPSDSGERIGFSTTILLAITVFLDVISSYIPNASTPIPLLCVVITLGVSLSFTCTLAVIFSLYFYHKDDCKPVHGVFVMFVKLFNAKFRKSSKIDAESYQQADAVNDARPMRDHSKNRISIHDIDYSPEEAHGKETTAGDVIKAHPMEITISWKDVSETIDKVCFTIGILFQGIIMISFTCYITLGSN